MYWLNFNSGIRMKRLFLISLLLMIVLITGVIPQSVYGADDEDIDMLTPGEQKFVSDISGKIEQARKQLKSYTIYKSRFGFLGDLLLSQIDDGFESIKIRRKSLEFSDCSINSSPDSMKDIAQLWNANVCSQFAQMRALVEKGLDKDTTHHDFYVWSQSIRQKCDSIEGWLTKIENTTSNRVAQLAKEMEKELEDDTDDSDDEFDCFIATAAYGTPSAKEIDELRRFRDEYLRDSYLGNEFIKFYNNYSPPIAYFISKHEILRTVVREGFVDPVVKVVEFTENWWAE